jgi:hypothetical protein
MMKTRLKITIDEAGSFYFLIPLLLDLLRFGTIYFLNNLTRYKKIIF